MFDASFFAPESLGRGQVGSPSCDKPQGTNVWLFVVRVNNVYVVPNCLFVGYHHGISGSGSVIARLLLEQSSVLFARP